MHALVTYGHRSSTAFILDLRLQEERVKRKLKLYEQNGVGGVQGLDITYGISINYHKGPGFHVNFCHR